jgi:hypothetical protein
VRKDIEEEYDRALVAHDETVRMARERAQKVMLAEAEYKGGDREASRIIHYLANNAKLLASVLEQESFTLLRTRELSYLGILPLMESDDV